MIETFFHIAVVIIAALIFAALVDYLMRPICFGKYKKLNSPEPLCPKCKYFGECMESTKQ